MFVVLVCAELYGHKHNIEIGFPDVPALDEFAGHCEATFRNESRRIRPNGAPAQKFVVDNIKIFDDSLNRWLDLTSAAQLLEWSQFYLLQPEGCESDVQGILEPPIRLRSPIERGTNKEKYFFLFHDIDFNGNGHLNREEIQRVFNVLCIYEVSAADVDKMFYDFDKNHDNVLSFAEFTKWMNAMPQVGDLLLRKSTEYWEAWQRRPDIRDSSQITVQERDAILQYLERGRNITDEVRRQEDELRRAHDEKLIQDREEELYRVKNRFVKKYGREALSPSPNRASVGAQSTPKPKFK